MTIRDLAVKCLDRKLSGLGAKCQIAVDQAPWIVGHNEFPLELEPLQLVNQRRLGRDRRPRLGFEVAENRDSPFEHVEDRSDAIDR